MAPRELLVATLLVGGCSAAVPVSHETGPLISRPDIQVGDRWTYWAMDYWTSQARYLYGIEVTYVKGDAILGVMRKGQGAPLEAAWTSSWNETVNAEGAVSTPNESILRFPFRIGSAYSVKWDVDFDNRFGRGEYGLAGSGRLGAHNERTVTVTGWEDVTVPAGTFHALRVEADGSYYRSDNVANAGLARDIIWYVPEVNRWVKRTSETWFFGSKRLWIGEELLRYEPAPRRSQ